MYTPNEIVRFMIAGADWLIEKHFGKNLIDRDVDILDPATGTGTFICELLEHFRGQPAKLKHKYLHELHANEVAILPYYVANLNIEATYDAISGGYEEFPNLCFVDTLDNVGLHTAAKGVNADLFGSVSEENVARIKRQNGRRISVIIGNPPYNANQANENDNNKNREYPTIDKRIKQTYIHASTAQKTKLYDMYARFFRWVSDRLNENGVLVFISNRSFIESRTFDGFRKTVAQEFSDIYVVDLGGDVRANPRLSGTKHNVFGIQTGVAISFMVKRAAPSPAGGRGRGERAARVFYLRRPEMETAEEKLTFLASHPMRDLDFDEVQPDRAGNWVNLTNNDFDTLLPLASKETKAAKTAGKEKAIFKLYSLGVSTNRDDWVTDFDQQTLNRKCRLLVNRYDEIRGSKNDFESDIKWSRNLKRRCEQGKSEPFDETRISRLQYRPYTSCYYYDSRLFVDERGPADQMGGSQCRVITLTGPGSSKSFHTIAASGFFSLDFLEKTPGLALHRYDESGDRIDNITDWALKQFTAHYKEAASTGSARTGAGKKKITKEAIFHYCYAVLHDPLYRDKYAQNLKREFPRIPFYADFWRWAAWGEALMALHIGYEAVAPFALTLTDTPDDKARAAGLSPKALLRADPESGSITLDSETTLHGLPAEAWLYKLGNRSALDWVLDQYKEKKPKDPTIREQFDTYRFADYKEKVIDLLMRVTTVSVESVRMTQEMRTMAR